jgi:hypothetical protein
MRLPTALVAWLWLVTSATPATVSPRHHESMLAGKSVPSGLVQALAAGGPKDEYTMTEQTEVLLDGKACKYADVPNDAQITLMEVSKDRVVLKVYFRRKK